MLGTGFGGHQSDETNIEIDYQSLGIQVIAIVMVGSVVF